MLNVSASELTLDYKPVLPSNKKMGIGIVGAGQIVQAAHLPAYQLAGFNVVGIYNLPPEIAVPVAKEFNIAKVYQTLDELLDDPEVQVVDIALPVEFQSEVVLKAAAKGKHVLCQKPMGMNYADAKKIADAAAEHDVKIAINHQMRWSPGIQAAKSLISRNWLGELVQSAIQVNVQTDWSNWEWLTKIEKLEMMYHSIHYMDASRYLMGKPESIFADTCRFPGEITVGETRSMIHMNFGGNKKGLIHDCHHNISPDMDDWFATFRVEGTEGIAKGTNGSLYNYPVGQADTIEFFASKVSESQWFKPVLDGRWFPHAFMGTMGELMCAIEENRQPSNSAEDGLLTIQMLFAAYKSAQEGRLVYLDEIQS